MVIYCMSHTPAKWYYNNTLLSLYTLKNALIVLDVQLSRKGVYTCIGTNYRGKQFMATSKLYISASKSIITIKLELESNVF